MIRRLLARLCRKRRRTYDYRTLTPDQQAAFDRAFVQMDQVFENIDKALKDLPK